MMSRDTIVVRDVTPDDISEIVNIVSSSDYSYCRFHSDELTRLLLYQPTVGAFSGDRLVAYLLATPLVPPTCWVGGFGVVPSEGVFYKRYFDTLLAALEERLKPLEVQHLFYSGSDIDYDWLKDYLCDRGFVLDMYLLSYDKTDFVVPSHGNPGVRLQAYDERNLPRLLEIERLCFDQQWRYDAEGFKEIARTYPYFVVALIEGQIVGYQFNTVDAAVGYLVRIAVHPDFRRRGVGIYLMATAIDYFAHHRVWKIVLNTQEDNKHAQTLYEWFGFRLVNTHGFVLKKTLL